MGRRLLLATVMVLLSLPALTAQDEDPALYAVGALGASNLYNTYFLLGTLADGYATAAYTAQFADELARDIIGLNESSIEVLRRLAEEGDLTGEDLDLVNNMIEAPFAHRPGVGPYRLRGRRKQHRGLVQLSQEGVGIDPVDSRHRID